MTATPSASRYAAEIIRAHNEDVMAPGSRMAEVHGCTCPILDNGWNRAHARWPAGDWWQTLGCPVHAGDIAVDPDPTPPHGLERPLRGVS